ncbi:MAG TPA: hypothetical protein VN226_06640 [Anaerolineales bacterium]|nr:hypothetical protein [Anaerolineales bacterium]
MTVHEISLLDIPRIAGLGSREDLNGIGRFIHGNNRHISELISASFPFTKNFGAFIEEGENTFALGISLNKERLYGNLTFISPVELIDEPIAQKALEYVLSIAGSQKIVAISAESANLEVQGGLKKVGFSSYYTQKIWRMDTNRLERTAGRWIPLDQSAKSELLHLYSQVTPPMIQFLEPFPPNEGRLLRYAEDHSFALISSGAHGKLITPYFLPDIEHGSQKLLNLINSLTINKDQEIYILTKSTMGWIDNSVENIGALMVEEQKVCFKRLVSPIPQDVLSNNVPARETRMVPSSFEKNSIEYVEQVKHFRVKQ